MSLLVLKAAIIKAITIHHSTVMCKRRRKGSFGTISPSEKDMRMGRDENYNAAHSNPQNPGQHEGIWAALDLWGTGLAWMGDDAMIPENKKSVGPILKG